MFEPEKLDETIVFGDEHKNFVTIITGKDQM